MRGPLSRPKREPGLLRPPGKTKNPHSAMAKNNSSTLWVVTSSLMVICAVITKNAVWGKRGAMRIVLARGYPMLRTILLIIIVLALLGSLPLYPYSSGWGYYPSGGLGLILIILIIWAVMDRGV